MKKITGVLYILVGLAFVSFAWVTFLTQTSRAGSGSIATNAVVATLVVVVLGAMLVHNAMASGVNRLALVVGAVYILQALLYCFGVLYWHIGTLRNFTHPLTQLDALYVALGTLSTVGSGTIAAKSELARGLQALQMLLDIGLVIFVLGMVVGRLIETRRADEPKQSA